MFAFREPGTKLRIVMDNTTGNVGFDLFCTFIKGLEIERLSINVYSEISFSNFFGIFKNLETLELIRTDGKAKPSSEMIIESLKPFFGTVKRLIFSWQNLDNVLFQYIEEMPNLEFIHLEYWRLDTLNDIYFPCPGLIEKIIIRGDGRVVRKFLKLDFPDRLVVKDIHLDLDFDDNSVIDSLCDFLSHSQVKTTLERLTLCNFALYSELLSKISELSSITHLHLDCSFEATLNILSKLQGKLKSLILKTESVESETETYFKPPTGFHALKYFRKIDDLQIVLKIRENTEFFL
jgi:hypothetical protein